MRTIRSVARMRKLALALTRSGRRIGFVPTMGYLHEGHLSLVRLARARADVAVLSLFVNPTQFGPREDLARYPRDFARDSRLCRQAGVDILFCPEASEMYAPDHSVYVEETVLSRPLCGAARPGHFRGVATVVAKLFNIVRPDVAVFGRKDAQQARVIERLVRDLNFPVRIVVAPTVREPDGLAMSSRNAYLSPEDRADAPRIAESLREAGRLYASGQRSAAVMRRAVRAVLARSPRIRVEYVEIVDYDSFRPIREVRGPALLAVAVRMGATRLIDNALLGGAARWGMPWRM
jgi:pantoate--beta-alanine ligase